MILQDTRLPRGKKKKNQHIVKMRTQILPFFPFFTFHPYLYLTPSSSLPSAQLSVSLTLTWYLTPQMVQRRTHSSLHLLRSSDRTDSYVPSQHTAVGAHLRGASANTHSAEHRDVHGYVKKPFARTNAQW